MHVMSLFVQVGYDKRTGHALAVYKCPSPTCKELHVVATMAKEMIRIPGATEALEKFAVELLRLKTKQIGLENGFHSELVIDGQAEMN